MLIESGEWTGEACLEAQDKMAQVRGRERLREEDDDLSVEGLGREPAAVLGDADTDGVLRMGTDGHEGVRLAVVALPESALPVLLPEKIEITQEGGSPAGEGAGVREYDVPGVRRAGAARDRHDGYVCGLELVLLSLYRCA